MGIGFPTAAGEQTAVGSISMNGTSDIPSLLPGNPPKELIAKQNRLQPDQSNGNDRATANEILRPVLDFLLMAIILIPVQRYTRSHWDAPDIEMVWVRVAQGVWISWLTHAAGLLDEALRVFLGIRLTQGLGTPTSVNKVYSKMSRWAEVVAEVSNILGCIIQVMTSNSFHHIYFISRSWLGTPSGCMSYAAHEKELSVTCAVQEQQYISDG